MALRLIEIADGFASTTIPSDISLPTGAATAAKQDTGNTSLGSIDAKLSSTATSANQTTANTSLASIDAKLSSTATAANQSTANTSLASIDTNQGAKADTAATSDTGTFSLIALVKRVAANITSLSSLFPTSLGQKTMANSLAITIASNQSAIPVTAGANSNGSVVNGTLTGTAASTETPPANAVGFVLLNAVTSSDPVRYRIGGVASTTAGISLDVDRDTGFIPCAANISICATANTGTNKYELLWILSA